jgi:malic enzyme
VPEPTVDSIIPGAFEPGVAEAVAAAVAEQSRREGTARL